MAKFKTLSNYLVEGRTKGSKNTKPAPRKKVPAPPYAGTTVSGYWVPTNQLDSVQDEFNKYFDARIDDLKKRILQIKTIKDVTWLRKLFGRWVLGKNYKHWLGLENYNHLMHKTEELKQILNEAGVFSWLRRKLGGAGPDEASMRDELIKTIDTWADEIRQSMDIFFKKRMKDRYLRRAPIEAEPEKPAAEVTPKAEDQPVDNTSEIQPESPETNTASDPVQNVTPPENKTVVPSNPAVINNNDDEIVPQKTSTTKKRMEPEAAKPKKEKKVKSVTSVESDETQDKTNVVTNPDFKTVTAAPSSSNPNVSEPMKKFKKFLHQAWDDFDASLNIYGGGGTAAFDTTVEEYENRNILFAELHDATLYEKTLICLEKLREIKS